MSINKGSPSQYGNDFKVIARKLFTSKDYKTIIKEFLNGSLNPHSREYIIKSINDIKIDHSNTKHARQIIMLVEGNVNVDMTVEHFLLLDEDNEYSMKIGNCVPVNVDDYKDLDIEIKLKKYEKNVVSEPFLKSFLSYGFTPENYCDKIVERTNKICQEYADTYNKLYEEIINE